MMITTPISLQPPGPENSSLDANLDLTYSAATVNTAFIKAD